MENPLTEEQIQKIQAIQQLPAEKQKTEFQKFLQTLTPEQLAYLKQHQESNTQCPFCLIAEKKLESHVVYEDNKVIAVLDIKPSSEGHILVIPKEHVQFSTELEDVGFLFNVANQAAKKIYDVLKLDTTLFLANGANAGQRVGHVIVHVIPRKENDGLQFIWEGKEISKEKLQDLRRLLTFELPLQPVQEPVVEEVDYQETFRIP